MRSTRINRTETARIRPLNAAVRNEHGPLSRLLADLGPVAAGLLAEPVASADGAYIDWHVPGVVAATRLDATPPDVAAKAEAELAALRPRIEELSRSLAGRGGPHAAEGLDLSLVDCLMVPGREHIFVVDGHPVLTAWGHVPDKGQGYRSGLTVVAPAGPARPAAAAPGLAFGEVARTSGNSAATAKTATTIADGEVDAIEVAAIRARPGLWPILLLWALFAALVAAIFYLLLRACAFGVVLAWLGWPGACPGGDRSGRMPVIGELQRRAADLETNAAADCRRQAEAAAVPAPAVPAPASDADVIRDAQQRTVEQTRGDLEITLIWHGPADLDLAVTFDCNGASAAISFQNKGHDVCGGTLDRDDNYDRHVFDPAEHIVWTNAAGVPPGAKAITVTYFNRQGDALPDVPFEVVVHRSSESQSVFRGIASEARARLPQLVTVLDH